MRLYLVVEGQTEEAFAKSVLVPHLGMLGVWVHPFIVETSRDAVGRKHRGGGRWAHWRRDLMRLVAQHGGPEVRFTTLFDLYGLPQDFPGVGDADANTLQRVERLERAMYESVGDHRLIPYLQRHELEALVLVGLDVLKGLLDDEADRNGLEQLRASIAGVPPEDVNDHPSSAPSKRLESFIPGYRKTLHGPLTTEGVGLAALRKSCPRFDAWVGKLEALSGAPT